MDQNLAEHDLPNAFEPYDERCQPTMLIAGYKETALRVPSRPAYRRPLTLTELTGPQRLERKLAGGAQDLSRLGEAAPQAVGQLIYVSGQLTDEDGRPVRGSVIEIWHANAAGKYNHRADAGNPAPLDPYFLGSGRTRTDDKGRYHFVTIKPGAYPVPEHPDRWWRAPHIHLSLFGNGFMSRLVTQMYFPGEPLNAQDLLLLSVPDAKAQKRCIARPVPMRKVPMLNAVGFRHDLVVRGRHQTPFGR